MTGEETSQTSRMPQRSRAAQLTHGGASAQVLRPFATDRARALRVGLTGGIGAGKSAVANIWRHMGFVVADADELAREVVAPGSEGLSRVARHFGEGVLLPDGALDRKALGQIVFGDEEARTVLESLTHPLIAKRADEILGAAGPEEVAVYDVPLLVEQRMEKQFDAVVIVDAPLDQRLQRLLERGLTREEAVARIDAQASEEQRRMLANIWIINGGSHEDLRAVSREVAEQWLLRPLK